MTWTISDDNYSNLKRLFARLSRDILPPQERMSARLDEYVQEWLQSDDGRAFTQWVSFGNRGFDEEQFARIDGVLWKIKGLGEDPKAGMMLIRNPLLPDPAPFPVTGFPSIEPPAYWPTETLLPKEALSRARGQTPSAQPKEKRTAKPAKGSPRKAALDKGTSKVDTGGRGPTDRPPVRPGKPDGGAVGKTKTASSGKRKLPPNMPPSYAKLDAMIGLESVKQAIITRANTFKANKQREKQGGKALDTSMHMVFTGNPGTGKTDTAKLVGEIYRDMGLLSKGTYIKTTPADLIVGYIRQTGKNTRQKIEEAIGGVLFIDEAYGLVKKNNHGNDFGPEAVEELLVGMETYRSDLVVILAGYRNEMDHLIKSNPGMESRLRTFIDFPDYTPDELKAIFMKMCRDQSMKLDDGAALKLDATIQSMYDNRGETFGNGRDVRNLLDRCVERQSDRLYGEDADAEDDESAIWVLIEDDIPDPSEVE